VGMIAARSAELLDVEGAETGRGGLGVALRGSGTQGLSLGFWGEGPGILEVLGRDLVWGFGFGGLCLSAVRGYVKLFVEFALGLLVMRVCVF